MEKCYLAKKWLTIFIGNNGEIFLNGFFLFLNIVLIIQAIIATVNTLYFSKDIEIILPLPFKTIEVLISKLIAITSFLYFTIILIGFIPLNILGITVDIGLSYFVKLIFSLIIIPIFNSLVITIITMTLMELLKKLKNKNLIQIFLTLILILILFLGLYFIFNNLKNIDNNYSNLNRVSLLEFKLKNINKYFLIINPIINILEKNIIFNNLINFVYLIIINLFLFFIFIFIGKKIYLKQLLKHNIDLKNNKIKHINLNKRIKKNKIYITYLKKEIKNIIKNPLFIMKCNIPVFSITLFIALILWVIIPFIKKIAIENNLLEEISFDIHSIFYIVGLIQIIGLFNKITVTSISREGKDAQLIKYLPINLYEQFILKNIPQIIINNILSAIILLIIYLEIGSIELKYFIYIFIINFILFFINSYLLLIINLISPKNKWDSEYEVFKNNKNILLQYLLIIFNIIFLYYFNDLFKKHNLDKSIILFIFILLIIFIILNIFINKFKNKLFNKIN